MARRRFYYPRRTGLAACCATECDYLQCYGSGNYGQTCSQGGLSCTIMKALSPAQDANSTSQGAPLPSTGQPAPGAGTPAPAPASGIMANLTNFQTPYPYLAIGGIIVVAALLIPGGRKAGSSAPNVFHYG